MEMLNEIAIDNQDAILSSLGLEPDWRGCIKCPCPIHGGDNPTGFSFEPNRHIWRCWTHHCHKIYGTNIFGLIKGINKYDDVQTAEFILKFVNGEIPTEVLNIKAYLRKKKKTKREVKVYSLSGLKSDSHKVDYFIKRGLKEDTLKEFQAFFCNKTNNELYCRACLPIYRGDDVIGFTGRDTTNNRILKWKHAPEGIPVGECLFGLKQAREYIKLHGVAVLVEGPTDVMFLHQNGIKIAVSPFGTNLSSDQIKLLIHLGVKTLILALDPDIGGQKGSKFIENKAKLYFNTINISNDLNGKDPSDLTENEILEKIKPKIDKIVVETKEKYGH